MELHQVEKTFLPPVHAAWRKWKGNKPYTSIYFCIWGFYDTQKMNNLWGYTQREDCEMNELVEQDLMIV